MSIPPVRRPPILPLLAPLLALVALTATACEKIPLANERQITILATNDIHGAVEPAKTRDGATLGGMAHFAGVVRATRQGLKQKLGPNAGVLVLDGGDQFQGTLLSNFNEGTLVYDLMSAAGYDAAVPGNHAYDFGPRGWLEDKVSSRTPRGTRREVIEELAERARFALVSANTYELGSLVDADGERVRATNIGCRPLARPEQTEPPRIDWSRARRPGFLQPWVIRETAGVRVAIIGIDHLSTPSTTTIENVDDLCFRDPFDAYREARQALEGRADVFVLLAHDGDSSNETGMSRMVQRLIETDGPRAVDAVVAGHTHQINDKRVANLVPMVQSGAEGQRFGRIDLIYDVQARTVRHERTRSMGGIALNHGACDPSALKLGLCTAGEKGPLYEGLAPALDAAVVTRIAEARAEIAPLASRVLGVAERPLSRNRIAESAVSNAMTDAFRAASGADVAFLNTGGLRSNVPEGTVTYEHLFEVLPFSNRGLVIGPMGVGRVLALLERSARTCGAFGALMQSGLRVEIERDCDRAVDAVDPRARLTRVETLAGEVLLDAARGIRLGDERALRVATLDFLAAGGSGFDGFKGVPVLQDLGIIREVLADQFTRQPVRWDGRIDGRWRVAKP